MQNEKFQINLTEGASKVEVVIRETDHVNELPVKPPVRNFLNGTLNAVAEFLQKRGGLTNQLDLQRSHILIKRQDISIQLVYNENDEYTRGNVIGTLQIHPKFEEFGINTGKTWTPAELGLFFKMNRSFFATREENMKLVTELMNFTATVNNSIQRSVKESGDRTDNFEQVVNSNLPKSFTLNIPVFKASKAESIEVETFAKVNGREVSFTLLSPAAQATIEEIRDQEIDRELELIREMFPEIPIIEQ